VNHPAHLHPQCVAAIQWPVKPKKRDYAMQRKFVRLEFYETYYYANIIGNIISDPFPYIRGIHEWYEDNEEEVFLPAFPKFSRLHGFAAHIIDSLIAEHVSDVEEWSLVSKGTHDPWVDRALKYHGFPCDGFRSWIKDQKVTNSELTEDHLYDYHQELRLCGDMETLVEHLSQEVFHVIFANRKLLAEFNEFMARALQLFFKDFPTSEERTELKGPGILNRVEIPAWVRRAVFYRDRGMCSLCQKDLSGTVSTQPDSQFDHIIPLAMGGLNDVTNIQRLCQKCNGSKSKRLVAVSSIYESWY
jgi:hypothetical protein